MANPKPVWLEESEVERLCSFGVELRQNFEAV